MYFLKVLPSNSIHFCEKNFDNFLVFLKNYYEVMQIRVTGVVIGFATKQN